MTSGWLYPIPSPETVPTSVTRAQAKITLTEAGLWPAAESAVAEFNSDRASIWFTDASVWERDHLYVSILGYEIGLDDDAIDEMFRQAVRVV